MTAATTTLTAERSSTAVGRLARTATEIAQPPLVLSLLLILASLLGDQWLVSIWSGVIAALFICLVPFAAVLVLAKRGRLTDHHVGDKKQRRPVMLWTLGSSLLGCGILAVVGAPPSVWGLIGGILCGIVALILISPIWKLSGHALTLGGATVSAVLMFGWLGLPFVVAAPLVCWSRVYLRDHSAPQVIVGFITGIVVFGASYTFIIG
ncbi:phosphatase PAP2 family protein [Pseudarthrobacter albicanus]|uniref:phosphatase PAP2 family protein n=1 Tax=Pseudarthrobacter albicanus TaxID=2823873 RepID=UPI001BADDA9E|nr:phosphatase PAP2 family protein [Pseudarthrobacter albicanus]